MNRAVTSRKPYTVVYMDALAGFILTGLTWLIVSLCAGLFIGRFIHVGHGGDDHDDLDDIDHDQTPSADPGSRKTDDTP